jgi:DNA-binding transcriptional LysR family regulator
MSASVGKSDLAVDDIDIAIRFGPGDYPGYHSVKLMDEFVTPMCSPALLEGPNAIRTPDDLANHTLIHDDTHLGVFMLQELGRLAEEGGRDEGRPGCIRPALQRCRPCA